MRWIFSVLTVAVVCVAAVSLSAAQDPPAKNPLEGNPDAIRGGMGLYRARCADCHGMDARGVRAPDITQVWASGRTDAGLFKTIKEGVPGTEMPSNPRVQDAEAWQILAYLRTLAALHQRHGGEVTLRRKNLSRQLRRLSSRQGRRRPSGTRSVAHRDRALARGRSAADPARRRRLRLRIRTGNAHTTVRAADPGRQEKRRPLLGPNHGYARADSGIREGQDEIGEERHAIGDADLRTGPAQRQRS